MAKVKHFFRSEPMFEVPSLARLGDGLNRLSRLPFRDYARTSWGRCHGTLDCGSDCIASKGFSYARTWLPGELPVDVYNVHLDAARCEGDIETRAEQVGQLLRSIRERSRDVAVVVAGDFNLYGSRRPDRLHLQDFLEAGLEDACDAIGCGEDGHVDRILLRSSDDVSLAPRSWEVPDGFETPDGEPLSDHSPIAVRVAWERR
ncbi:MAG: endonuclease/exonuclease/phosphatase family protein [Myxococcota bacterium]